MLRCASYASGLLVLVSLGLRSRSETDLTAGIASLVAVTFYASELIGAPLFGAWSDRIGRKPFMILGPVFGGIAAQLMGVTMVIPILVVVRILQIMQHELGNDRASEADVLVRPDLRAFWVLEFWKATAIIEAGRRAAEAALPTIREKLEELHAEGP